MATVTTSILTSAGTHSLVAVYGGNTTYAAGTSAPYPQTVKAGTATTLTAAPNPSAVGTAVTFTATVTSAAGVPTGVVTFFMDNIAVYTNTLDVNGQTTFTTSTNPTESTYLSPVPLPHTMTAVYGSDSLFWTSTSPNYYQNVIAGVTTTLVSSPNPSTPGQPVVIIATITSGSSATPTGTVTFSDGTPGAPNPNLGTAPLSSSILGTATATVTTTALTILGPPHTLVAVYSGDSSVPGCTFDDLPAPPNGDRGHTVTQTPTTTTLVDSGPSPSNPGQGVMFTATVLHAPGTPIPTGKVAFVDGTALVARVPLNSSGMAVYTILSMWTTGTHTITAIYSGDTTFSPSQDSKTQIVRTLTTAVTSSPNPSTPGQSVTFTATVTNVDGTGYTPTGIVTFKDGSSYILGTGALAPAPRHGHGHLDDFRRDSTRRPYHHSGLRRRLDVADQHVAGLQPDGDQVQHERGCHVLDQPGHVRPVDNVHGDCQRRRSRLRHADRHGDVLRRQHQLPAGHRHTKRRQGHADDRRPDSARQSHDHGSLRRQLDLQRHQQYLGTVHRDHQLAVSPATLKPQVNELTRLPAASACTWLRNMPPTASTDLSWVQDTVCNGDMKYPGGSVAEFARIRGLGRERSPRILANSATSFWFWGERPSPNSGEFGYVILVLGRERSPRILANSATSFWFWGRERSPRILANSATSFWFWGRERSPRILANSATSSANHVLHPPFVNEVVAQQEI